MDKNIDLRISRTHKMIKEAFFELMDSIGFEKITVQGLTKKAMISRTTFYLHYQDKYDLLDKIENETQNCTDFCAISHASEDQGSHYN